MDLPLSEGNDLTESHIRLDPRLLARHVRSYSSNHNRTCIDHVLDHPVATYGFRKALIEGAHRVLPIEDALGPTLRGSEDGVFVRGVHKRVEITPVPVLKRLAHNLDVLLRHRLRSIPRHRGGANPGLHAQKHRRFANGARPEAVSAYSDGPAASRVLCSA